MLIQHPPFAFTVELAKSFKANQSFIAEKLGARLRPAIPFIGKSLPKHRLSSLLRTVTTHSLRTGLLSISNFSPFHSVLEQD